MDEDKIESRLFESAKQAATGRNMVFGLDAENDLHVLASQAATEILRLSAKSQNSLEPLIKNGEAVFSALAEEMYTQSAILTANSGGVEMPYRQVYPGILGEATLKKSLKKLCPVWPICLEAYS